MLKRKKNVRKSIVKAIFTHKKKYSYNPNFLSVLNNPEKVDNL